MLGSSGKHSIYIVRKADDVGPGPSAQSDFCDYSGVFVDWNIKQTISQVSMFKGMAAGNTIDTDDFKAGNLLYVLSGTNIIGKFVIDRPAYRENETVNIRGYQSTGSVIENRKIFTETTSALDFSNEQLQDILTTSDTGIITDDTTQNLLAIGTITDGTVRYNFKSDRLNRISALTKLGKITNHEWVVTHGTNDATPYSEGDTLDFCDRIGSTSGYTLRFTGSSLNNAKGSSNNETNSLINDVIITSNSIIGNKISTNMFASTGTKTCTDGALDGWLYTELVGAEDLYKLCDVVGTISSGSCFVGLGAAQNGYIVCNLTGDEWYVKAQTNTATVESGILGTNTDGESFSAVICAVTGGVLCVHKNHGLSDGDYVKIDSEKFQLSIKSTDTNYDCFAIVTDSRRSSSTTASYHKTGSDVVNLGDGTDTVITVDCTDGFANAGTRSIMVGSEIMPYNACTGTTFTTQRSFEDAYAHGDNIRVQQYEEAGESYTKNNWDTGTINSIRTNGIHSSKLTENSVSIKNDLDLKAQSIIENKDSINRIDIDIDDYHEFWDNVTMGDSVCFCNSDVFNLPEDDYRFLGFNYCFKYGRVKLSTYFNKDSIRTYALTDYSYASELQEHEESKRQESTDDISDSTWTDTTGVGNNQNKSIFGKMTDVSDPENTYDAVNKGYVDNQISKVQSANTSSEFWTDGTNPYIVPENNCHICVINGCATGCFISPIMCGTDTRSTRSCATSCMITPVIKDPDDSNIIMYGDLYPSGNRDLGGLATFCWDKAYVMCVFGVTCVCSPVICGDCFTGGSTSYGTVNLSDCANNIQLGVDSVNKGYQGLNLIGGTNVTLSESSGDVTINATSTSLWADGTNPYIIPDIGHANCGLCLVGDIVSSVIGGGCIGKDNATESWKEIHVTCVESTFVHSFTCVCSPTLCNTTCAIFDGKLKLPVGTNLY